MQLACPQTFNKTGPDEPETGLPKLAQKADIAGVSRHVSNLHNSGLMRSMATDRAGLYLAKRELLF